MCWRVRAQAICAAACLAEHWPLLVVAPSSMLLTWLEQLRTWLPPQCCPDTNNIVVITSGKVRALHSPSLVVWQLQSSGRACIPLRCPVGASPGASLDACTATQLMPSVV